LIGWLVGWTEWLQTIKELASSGSAAKARSFILDCVAAIFAAYRKVRHSSTFFFFFFFFF
jgi:hypothetical protein